MSSTPITAAALLAAPLLGVTLFFGSGAADPPPIDSSCALTLGGPAAAGPATVPSAADQPAPQEGEDQDNQQALSLTAEQVSNAQAVLDAVRAARLPQPAAVVALTAAWQASSLLTDPPLEGIAASPSDASGTALSQGLFGAQPAVTDLGGAVLAPGSGLQEPAASIGQFLRRLSAVPLWLALPVAEAARRAQGSANAAPYEPYVLPATALAAALSTPERPGLVCTGAGTTVAGPGGTFAPQSCSVRPDPTTGRGCLTPRTASLAAQLLAQGWQLSCWDPHAWNPRSDHPQGRACDITTGPAGRFPTPSQAARGDALAAALQASAPQTGINYLIWSGRIWSAGRSAQGWRPYNGGGIYDAHTATGGHYDHVHVSLL